MAERTLGVSVAVPGRRLGVSGLARRAPAWIITAAFGLAYLLAAPATADLATATYRSDMFGRVGLTLWDNGWYAGHHLPAYSLLAPALGWLIGPRLLAALSMTIAAALFAELIKGRFPARALRIAAVWFAFGAGVSLLSSRVAFDLGLALGLGALLSARRGGRALALALAPLTALASPVAGAFLALAALAWALAARPRAAGLRSPARRSSCGPPDVAAGARRPLSPAWRLALAVGALTPIALLALAFPEGGSQPFDASSALPALAGVLIVGALIPASERVLRIGALLYAVVLAGAFLLATPVGGNADRLGALFAGPIAACVLAGRSPTARPLVLLALAPLLLYWQVTAPVSDFASAASDPSVHASYYAPLIGRLSALGAIDPGHPLRVEVVATANHSEANLLAPHVTLARGWERQLDRRYNALFYTSAQLTPARYRAWLLDAAVAYVALPDAPLDYSGSSEARLLRGEKANGGGGEVRHGARPPAYLREVWRSAHWRLFAVLRADPLAEPPAVLTQLGSDSFTLDTPRAGTFGVRVRFTPYWALANAHGCVRRAPGGWTELQGRSAGRLHVVIDFSLARVFDHGPRCR
jgi:hypothetical protein